MSALPPKGDIRTWPALRSAQQLRQLGAVGGDPPRFVARQQLGRRSPAGFVFLGKLLPVVVAHETMHGGVHVAGTMLPNSRTTL
jgi:hypothetical protein